MTPRLRVRTIVGAAYAIVAKAPVTMLGLVAVSLLGLAIWFWAVDEVAEPVAKGAVYLVFVLLAGYLLQYALFILVLGALSRGAADIARGESFDRVSGLAVALRRLPQLLGATWYLFVIGTSALCVLFTMPPHIEYGLPALVLGLPGALVLALSMPVSVMERRGPIASTTRAFDLARGNRWRLVAALVAAVPVVGLTIVVVAVTSYPISLIVGAFGCLAIIAVATAVIAVAYVRLAPERATAAIFD